MIAPSQNIVAAFITTDNDKSLIVSSVEDVIIGIIPGGLTGRTLCCLVSKQRLLLNSWQLFLVEESSSLAKGLLLTYLLCICSGRRQQQHHPAHAYI